MRRAISRLDKFSIPADAAHCTKSESDADADAATGVVIARGATTCKAQSVSGLETSNRDEAYLSRNGTIIVYSLTAWQLCNGGADLA